jgi:hypothetical protein
LLAGALLESPIVVEVTTADGREDPAAARLVAAGCNEALERSGCTDAEAPATEPTWLRVRVRVDDAAHRATLDFEHPDGTRASRAIDFRPDDPPAAQQRAIGLVIAAYRLEHPPEPPAPPDAPPGASARSATTPAVGHAPARWRLDVGVLVGPGLDPGGARYGGLLRGGLRLGTTPVYALLSARGAVRPGSPEVLWLSGGAGLLLDLALTADGLSLAAHVSAIAEHVRASARDPSSGAEDDGATTRYGGLLGAELAVNITPGLAIFAGGEIAVARRLVIEVGGTVVGRQSPVQLSGVAGLRF